MQWFFELISNEFLIIGLSSWLLAQVLKMIIHSIINRKIDWLRLVGDGGMPSGHSATVTSIAVATMLIYPLNSFEVAISTILAVVVCHDACGVRHETGKQAVLITEIAELINTLSTDKVSDDVKLKTFVGHTIPQVIGGVLTGIINALFIHFVFFA